MGLWSSARSWWFGGSSALAERTGSQLGLPGAPLVEETRAVGPDGALQMSTVWRCIENRANAVAALPLFVYENKGEGKRELARSTRLYALLHDSPNRRMTPLEFWRAMMMNLDLRGNAYARIERDAAGEALAIWPMPADQVQPVVLEDGSMVYEYAFDGGLAVLAEESVLHLKGLGNGTIGLPVVEFMRATTDEAAKAQASASRLFGNGGKPTGVLMVDHVLSPEQRAALQKRFGEMALGPLSRLYVLEASMKYQQLSMTPEDQQLLETRRFSVEEICRWFGMPPVMAFQSDGVNYNGTESMKSFFYAMSVRPTLVAIEQALRKRVLTSRQREAYSVEFSFEALLRADSAGRASFYASGAQNGWLTRNEIRQLENLPQKTAPGADQLTAQSNLVPLEMMGRTAPTGGSNAPAQDPIAQ